MRNPLAAADARRSPKQIYTVELELPVECKCQRFFLFEHCVIVIGYRQGTRSRPISKLDADWFISILLDSTADVAILVTSC